MARATVGPSAEAPRRRRRRPENITADLLDAAAVEFAAHGFEGASTRRIAERAGAHQPQINYHFASKEHLWQETVSRLFARLDAEAAEGSAAVAEADAATELIDAFVATLRRFIRFSAAHPELNRIINQEATAPSVRLDWLTATHLRPRYDLVDATWIAIRATGRGVALPTSAIWELITSYGALHFANAPMLSLLGTTTGSGQSDADAQADRIVALLGLT